MQNDIIAGLGELLRNADPSNPSQMADADLLAGAAMTMAMAFVQERVGKDAAVLVVNSMFEQAAARVADGKPQPAGSTLPMLHPTAVPGDLAAVQARAEVMFKYLSERPSTEADIEAKASIWAATGYLRRRLGDEGTLGFLSFIRSKVGMLGWFEQMPMVSTARH